MGISLVLGFFDGVHKAHKAVINSALEFSEDVVLITFKESPAVYFGGNKEYVLSRSNSIKKIKALGVKEVVELDFSKIAKWSALDYLEFLINNYHPVSISTGYNHYFGRDKLGSPDFLEEKQEEYNYKYICTPKVSEKGVVISSSLIRELLMKGDIKKANYYLESNFVIEGKVVEGAKLGRAIGFPTANIYYPNDIIEIPYGVYAVKIFGKAGIMNWGMKPTVNNTKKPVVEVHILDFNENIYNKNIKIEVIQKIRDEKKFSGLEELKNQILKDIEECLKL